MKTFTLKLEKVSLKGMFADLKRAAKTGVPNIIDDEMACGSVDAMMEAVSRSKLEAFAAIVEHKPKSIKELAELLKKDLGNVSRDVKGLELIGLVELKKDKRDDPRAVRPIAKYELIAFDFTPARKAKAGI